MRLIPKRFDLVLATDYTLSMMCAVFDARRRYSERHSQRGRVAVFSVGKLLIVWDRDNAAG